MLGREFQDNIKQEADILVFAAHPDDEVLGLSSILYSHQEKRENAVVTYVTNGSGLVVKAGGCLRRFQRIERRKDIERVYRGYHY